jgi:ankyrin repeat protein
MSYFEGHFINDGTTHECPDHLKRENQETSKENIALFKASKAGSMLSVQNALSKGAKPNFFFNPEDSKNALHVASEEGHTEVVEHLLENGAVPDCLVVSSKDTALTLACKNDRGPVATSLLKAGANMNHTNAYGNTAIHEAIREDFIGLAYQLLNAGADVSIRNHKGSTPLHFLCYTSPEESEDVRASQEFAKSLIQQGADVNVPDNQGLTPFLVCCASGREDLMDILLEHGADSNACDNKERSVVDVAEFYEQSNIVSRFSKKSKK